MDEPLDIDKARIEFENNWVDKMVEIWREKLYQFKAIDSGHLYRTVSGTVERASSTILTHSFAMYGIYVNNGTGIFYKKGNGGDLPFLGKEYRREHKLDRPKRVGPAWGGNMAGGVPRQVRPWINKRYFASCKKLINVEAEMLKDEAVELIHFALDAIFDSKGRVVKTVSETYIK